MVFLIFIFKFPTLKFLEELLYFCMDKNEYENNKLYFVCLAEEGKKACSTKYLKMNKFTIIKTKY